MKRSSSVSNPWPTTPKNSSIRLPTSPPPRYETDLMKALGSGLKSRWILRPTRILLLILTCLFSGLILIQLRESYLPLGFLGWSESSSRTHLPEFCYDPFRLKGHVGTIEPSESESTSEAHWIVHNPSPRRRTRYEASEVGQDFVVPSIMARLSEGERPDWLRNRTIIFIGDSLDRNLVHFFSNEAFEPGSHRYLTKATDPEFAEPTTVSHRIGMAHQKVLGFKLSNWFLMGSEVEGPASFFHPGEDEPQPIETRINHFFTPLLGTLLNPKPELVIFNVGLWDLVYISESAADQSRRQKTHGPVTGSKLTPAELSRHESRFLKLVELLIKTFPDPITRLVYRTIPDSSSKAKDNAMSVTRIRQLDQLHVRLIRRLNRLPNARTIDVLDWASLTRGLTNEIADLVHFKPGKAQWLYAELVLHHLRRLVLGDTDQTKWADCENYLNAEHPEEGTSTTDKLQSNLTREGVFSRAMFNGR